MTAIEEITTRAEFDGLEAEWRGLLAAGAPATVFQTWPWQTAWLDVLGRGAALRTLVLRDWRNVVAIAPLVIRRAYGLPLRRLQWIGTGVSDYLDLLIRPGFEADAIRAVGAYLTSRASRDWDAVDLHQLRAGSPCPDGLPAAALPQAVTPYRPLPRSVDDLHAQFGKKLRGNLRYARRVLERDHAVELACAASAELDDEMTALFTLHARRWRARWQPGVLSGRSIQAFHRRAARDLLDENVLRLHALRLDGRTVASLYCFAYAGVGYYYLGGFEPELSRHSIGTLLTAHALEEAVREGCREFDFLRGREPYKYRWGCIDRENQRLIGPGRGALAGCAPRALIWEQAIADRYEAAAHGGHGSHSTLSDPGPAATRGTKSDTPGSSK